MKPGQVHTLRITGLDGDALGEGTVGDVTLKVAGATPGDCVRVRVDHVSPHQPVAWATLVEAEQRGDSFRRPPCHWAAPLRGDCGGCPALHLTDDARREMLLQHLETVLAPLGLEPPRPPFHDAPLSSKADATDYRNRANYVLERRRSGRVRLGSWAPRSHDVARMDGCLVVRPPIDEVARALSDLLTDSNVPIHPPAPLASGDGSVGALRYLTIRSTQDGEALVDLVISTPEPPWLDSLLDRILALEPVVGVATSVNASSGNALRVAPSTHRRGRFTVTEQVGEGELAVDLIVAAATFTQLHTEVAGRMYRRAADWLASQTGESSKDLNEPRVLWDLYCGVGGLGRTVARAMDRSGVPVSLWGAESVAHAVELAGEAVEAAADESFPSRFERHDLARGLPEGWSSSWALTVNPPRRGLHPKVVEGLVSRVAGADGPGPSFLIYMSCNPKSFVRDARRLIDNGWQLDFLEAHDMLPGTAHVELLAGLRRLNI